MSLTLPAKRKASRHRTLTGLSGQDYTVTPYWAPKAGNRADEYEDAYAPQRHGRWNGASGEEEWRCAVADGATEAAHAGIWAKVLARAFVAGALGAEDFAAQLVPLRRYWNQMVDHATAGRPLPWYAEEKRRAGAYAAVVGLVLDSRAGVWSALAVGDCCLFHVRHGELLYSFPLRQSSEFGSRPVLVASLPGREVPHALRVTIGEWRPGDQFMLASDALAAWFLREVEAGARPWALPKGLSAPGEPERAAAFAAWIDGLRSAQVLRNDDVTLVHVEPQTHALAATL